MRQLINSFILDIKFFIKFQNVMTGDRLKIFSFALYTTNMVHFAQKCRFYQKTTNKQI